MELLSPAAVEVLSFYSAHNYVNVSEYLALFPDAVLRDAHHQLEKHKYIVPIALPTDADIWPENYRISDTGRAVLANYLDAKHAVKKADRRWIVTTIIAAVGAITGVAAFIKAFWYSS